METRQGRFPPGSAFRAPAVSSISHVSPYFFSRDHKLGQSELDYVDGPIREYEDMLEKLQPSSVAALILGFPSGATLGAVPAAEGYLARLRALCGKHGALFIFDEDLGADDQPISAVLVGVKVHQATQSKQSTLPFVFVNIHTKVISIGCAAVLATQQVVVSDDLLSKVQAMGDLLERELRDKTPSLKEVCGLGLFRAVEFATQEGSDMAAEVARTCLSYGLAVYICSPATYFILFAPLFIINEHQQVKELVGIFSASTSQVPARRGLISRYSNRFSCLRVLVVNADQAYRLKKT